jgi:hypothetical protein
VHDKAGHFISVLDPGTSRRDVLADAARFIDLRAAHIEIEKQRNAVDTSWVDLVS